MAGYLSGLRALLRRCCDAQLRLWAGAVFVVLALVSIEYDEIIAPKMDTVCDACAAAAGDLGRLFGVAL